MTTYQPQLQTPQTDSFISCIFAMTIQKQLQRKTKRALSRLTADQLKDIGLYQRHAPTPSNTQLW